MILDMIDHAALYQSAGKDVQMVLQTMQEICADSFQPGKIELDGERVYLLAKQYRTRRAQGALMEAHRQYIDVMYMVEGEEIIYVKPVPALEKITKAYDEVDDALLAERDDNATVVWLRPGSFLILFPQDAHCPACNTDGEQSVKKIIGKVRC